MDRNKKKHVVIIPKYWLNSEDFAPVRYKKLEFERLYSASEYFFFGPHGKAHPYSYRQFSHLDSLTKALKKRGWFYKYGFDDDCLRIIDAPAAKAISQLNLRMAIQDLPQQKELAASIAQHGDGPDLEFWEKIKRAIKTDTDFTTGWHSIRTTQAFRLIKAADCYSVGFSDGHWVRSRIKPDWKKRSVAFLKAQFLTDNSSVWGDPRDWLRQSAVGKANVEATCVACVLTDNMRASPNSSGRRSNASRVLPLNFFISTINNHYNHEQS